MVGNVSAYDVSFDFGMSIVGNFSAYDVSFDFELSIVGNFSAYDVPISAGQFSPTTIDWWQSFSLRQSVFGYFSLDNLQAATIDCCLSAPPVGCCVFFFCFFVCVLFVCLVQQWISFD